MPIDITNKEEKQIALTGAEIEETLLQAHLSKDAIAKIEGLQSSASEIDNIAKNVLYTNPDFLIENNCVVDFLDMNIVDGGYVNTNWIPDTSKDFTIAIVQRDDGYGSFGSFYSGVTETDRIWLGRTRNTTYSNFGVWIKDEGVDNINNNSEFLPTSTVLTVISYDASEKKFYWKNNNGSLRNKTLTDGLDPFTIPFYLGASNENGIASTNRIAVGDFAVYPRLFSTEDFELQYEMFTKKWNLDTFTKKINPNMTSKEMYEYVYRGGVLWDKQDYINHKKQYINTRLFSADRVAIVGDSITHGVGSTNFKSRRWASRLKNHLNYLNDSSNYGFENTYYFTGDFTSSQYHKVSHAPEGNWTVETDTASGIVGYEKYTSTVSTEIIFTIDDLKGQTSFRVYGINAINTSGSYNVYCNNILLGTTNISSNTSRTTQKSVLYPLANNGSNGAVIKIVAASGTIGIVGIEYTKNESDILVNVYAQAGRKTRDVSEQAVSYIMSNNKVVYWCLGYNDKGLYTVPSDWTKIQQVLDWVESYAKINNTCVIFCDFIWNGNLTNPVKIKMKNISSNLGFLSHYIEMGKNITSNAVVNPNTTYLINELASWIDVAHPNDKGHSLVFNNIRLECGL